MGWADIYRLQPLYDERRPNQARRTASIGAEHLSRGIQEQEVFGVWLDENYDQANWFPEQTELYTAGFDSVKWACTLLKRTIQWEFNSKWDTRVKGKNEEQMGFTEVVSNSDPKMPFTIRISISADYVWPLLVKDYSEAEKAATSFTLASIMVHELSVSRCEHCPVRSPDS